MDGFGIIYIRENMGKVGVFVEIRISIDTSMLN